MTNPILITTIYKGSAVVQAIKQFSPKRVYFLVDEPPDDIRIHSIKMIRDIFSDLEFYEIEVKMYDIVNIAEKSIKVIKKESQNKVIIHISEGRKTMGLGLLFGAYVMKNYVDSAYYIIEETNQPIKIPLMELNVSKKKRDIMKCIDEGIDTIGGLVKKLNIKSSTLYVHLKELRDDGFLTKKIELTEIGKIILLNE